MSSPPWDISLQFGSYADTKHCVPSMSLPSLPVMYPPVLSLSPSQNFPNLQRLVPSSPPLSLETLPHSKHLPNTPLMDALLVLPPARGSPVSRCPGEPPAPAVLIHMSGQSH
jgi:hypothetical protein